MPNRYFQQDPRLSGMLQFLAGFGQANRETQIANAQIRSQQNQVLGAGIGKGIGNLFNVPAQELTARMQAEHELQNATTLQRGQQAGQIALQGDQQAGQIALENRRTLNDLLQAELPGPGRRRIPSTMFGPGAMQPMVAPPVAPDDGGMGPPSPVQQPPPRQPAQSFGPFDPMYAGPAARATAKYIGLKKGIEQLIDEGASQEDIDRAQLYAIPQALALTQELESYREKKPQGPKDFIDSGQWMEKNGWIISADDRGVAHSANVTDVKQRTGAYVKADGTRMEFQPNSLYDLPDGRSVTTNENGSPVFHESRVESEKAKIQQARAKLAFDAVSHAQKTLAEAHQFDAKWNIADHEDEVERIAGQNFRASLRLAGLPDEQEISFLKEASELLKSDPSFEDAKNLGERIAATYGGRASPVLDGKMRELITVLRARQEAMRVAPPAIHDMIWNLQRPNRPVEPQPTSIYDTGP